MKRFFQKHATVLWLLCAAFLLITAVLQVIALALDYETDANYYRSGALLPSFAILSAFLAAGIGVVSVLATDPQKIKASPFEEPIGTTISAILGSVGCVLLAKTLLGRAKASTIALLAAVLLLLSALYMLLCRMHSIREKASVIGLLGFAPVLGSILVNGYLYFDPTVEMNSPVKVSAHIALLFLMLSFTGEVRYLLGIAKPRFYCILTVCYMAASLIAAPSLIFVYVTGRLDRTDYLACGILLSLYFFAGLAHMLSILSGKNTESTGETEGRASTDAEICEDTTTDPTNTEKQEDNKEEN